MTFKISTKRAAQVLILAVLCLTFASLAAQFIIYIWGREGYLALLQTFNVGEDANIPTWYSSVTLLLCSILLAVIAAAKKTHGDRYTRHWAVLSVVFVFLSIDEVATIHEKFSTEPLGFDTGGFLYGLFHPTWVIFGIIFVLVVLLSYLRVLASLPRKTRYLFLVAGALFVAGALGMEALSGRLIHSYGGGNFENLSDATKIVVALQTAIEELLEMSGIVIFVYALLSYASSYVKEVTVRIDADTK